MVMYTLATGHMTRGWDLAGWRKTRSSVPSTLDRGATTRGTAMASMRTKWGQQKCLEIVDLAKFQLWHGCNIMCKLYTCIILCSMQVVQELLFFDVVITDITLFPPSGMSGTLACGWMMWSVVQGWSSAHQAPTVRPPSPMEPSLWVYQTFSITMTDTLNMYPLFFCLFFFFL